MATETDIPTIVEHYVTALLWTTSCQGMTPDCDNGPDCDVSLWSYGYDLSSMSAEALADITGDVTDFVTANLDDLATLAAEQTGHDFLLTREGAGVGFWDRGLGDIGDRLTDAARIYGSTVAYVGDDGMIHVQ